MHAFDFTMRILIIIIVRTRNHISKWERSRSRGLNKFKVSSIPVSFIISD